MLIQQLSPEAGVQVRITIISDIRCSYCDPAARSFIAMYDTAWSGFLFLSRGKKRKLMISYFASYTEGVLPPALPLASLRLPPTSSPDIHLSIHHRPIVPYSSSTIQLHNTSTEKRKGKTACPLEIPQINRNPKSSFSSSPSPSKFSAS